MPVHIAKRMTGPQKVAVPVAQKAANNTEGEQSPPPSLAAAAAALPAGSGKGGSVEIKDPPALNATSAIDSTEAFTTVSRKHIIPEIIHDTTSAPTAAEAQPFAKKPKRITPALVQPLLAATPAKLGDADKAPKRITPTPLGATLAQAQFEKIHPVVGARPAEPSPVAAQPSSSHRRITPVPVAPADSFPAPNDFAAKPGLSIAALAMAAGQKAAEKRT